ncbi:TIGR03089 family protein [Marmoricola endophyticus]|nr:TIGR03089 family protein [Marmoricola endophyticus]
MAHPTFEQALTARLRTDPGQPFVTFYDDTTGERTELSVTTYANWVAKTAGVLVEDADLSEGSTVRLDLPTHWLGPVLLGACWLVGAEVVGEGADLWVGVPDRVPPSGERMVTGLGPFAARVADPPRGVLDLGALWPGQPDSFLGLPAGPDAVAYDGAGWAELSGAAGTSADRVLTDLNPVTPDGAHLLVASLAGPGSVVWVADADPAGWDHRASVEQATRQVRAPS